MDVIHEEVDFECNTGMDGKPVLIITNHVLIITNHDMNGPIILCNNIIPRNLADQ